MHTSMESFSPLHRMWLVKINNARAWQIYSEMEKEREIGRLLLLLYKKGNGLVCCVVCMFIRVVHCH